jgi:hypothetical protein
MSRIKKLIVGLLMLGLVGMYGWFVTKTFAASTDSIQLLVQPAVNYSVQITSADANVAYNFGTVDLNRTTLSERPAVVKNNGNIISEWQVSAQVEAGNWTLGESTGAQNAAVLKALFNSRYGEVPTAAHYNTLNGSTITLAAKAAENQTMSTDTAITSTIAINEEADLYFMLHTPENVSTSADQTLRVYVTAVAP